MKAGSPWTSYFYGVDLAKFTKSHDDREIAAAVGMMAGCPVSGGQ